MPNSAALELLQQSIISGDASLAASLVRAKAHMSAEEQIAIYAQAYRTRLRQAVLSDYPCLAHHYDRLPGVVDGYVATTQSQSYNLDFYPFEFAHYAKTLLPAEMAEMAELESAVAQCFMTHGSPPLTLDDVPQDEELLGQMKFYLRAPYHLPAFTHDVDTAMTNYKKGKAVTQITPKQIYLLVYRPNNDVVRRRLEAGEYLLLQAIEKASSFSQAIEKVLTETGMPDEAMAAHIMRWLPAWISDGCLSIKT